IYGYWNYIGSRVSLRQPSGYRSFKIYIADDILIYASLHLGGVTTSTIQLPLCFPLLPSGLSKVLTYHQVANPTKLSYGQIQCPIDPAIGAQVPRDKKPSKCEYCAGSTSSQNLLRGVVIQIDAADSNTRGTNAQCEGEDRLHQIGGDNPGSRVGE